MQNPLFLLYLHLLCKRRILYLLSSPERKKKTCPAEHLHLLLRDLSPPGQACGVLPTCPPSPFLVAQPGQLGPGFLPESFLAELEEGCLVSSSQLFSPQTLLRHGQAETGEGAGASIVLANFTPLGTEQSIVFIGEVPCR